MTDKLVTVASFRSLVEGQLATNRLLEAGIHANLVGDNTANIFGFQAGILDLYIEVPEEDAELARNVLAVVPEKLTPYEPIPGVEPPDEDEKVETPEDLTSADARATRALRSALFGMLVLPLFFHLYTFWITFRIVTTDEDLSGKGTAKLYAALFIAAVRTLFSAYLFKEFGWQFIHWILFLL